MGLLPEDFAADDTVDVWPENWPVVQFFEAISAGAWQFGSNGPIGIRPEALREVRLSMGVGAQQWRAMFPDVRVMEAEALDTMNRNRNANG